MNGMKLNEQATKELVNNIGREELFDEEWVDTDFRDALEAQYLEG